MIRNIITRIQKMTFGLKVIFFLSAIFGPLLIVVMTFGSSFEDEATGEVISRSEIWQSGDAPRAIISGLILVSFAFLIYFRKKIVRIFIPLGLVALSILHSVETGEIMTLDFASGILWSVIVYLYLSRSRWVGYYFSDKLA